MAAALKAHETKNARLLSQIEQGTADLQKTSGKNEVLTLEIEALKESQVALHQDFEQYKQVGPPLQL